MKRLLMLISVMVAFNVHSSAQITLEYCMTKAEENYPLVKKYDLVSKTGTLNLSDINKSWLPRIGVYGQITYQNEVPSFPDALKGVLNQMGHEMRGLSHTQYKAGVDISQNIWDGGMSKQRRKVERAVVAESDASIRVQMYAVREKVQNLYFGILLMNEQIAQTQVTIELLKANHGRLLSMVANGTAMRSDAEMVEAQLLTTTQLLVEAKYALNAYNKVLELYIGESLEGRMLIKPSAEIPLEMSSIRPELGLFDAQLKLNDAREDANNTSVMPRVGFFAQTYYGYPGLNYFESMVKRSLSFNFLAGVKLSWNIDSFYTKKNNRSKLLISSRNVSVDKELFLFNSKLQTESQLNAINGLREMMKDDIRIVELRANVRNAAESQLANGVIDATALLSKISDENQARISASYHEIQLLQNIYKLKYILNR